MKQKTEIEIVLRETVVYSRRNERFETFCNHCNCMVEMATPHIAALMTRSTERTIFRFVEAGDLHFIEDERVLICLSSLTRKLAISLPRGAPVF